MKPYLPHRPKHSFAESLDAILMLCQRQKEVKLRDVFRLLSGKGYAILFIILSLPFCIPVQIPGFSTPFGVTLAFLALRFAFAKRLWWPKWILEKSFPSHQIEKLAAKTKNILKKSRKILRPRLLALTQNRFFQLMHGMLIFCLSLLLSLPLPIPMTNLLAAMPIFFIGLGLFEDDGISIIIAYLLAFICFTIFLGLFLFGKAKITNVIHESGFL